MMTVSKIPLNWIDPDPRQPRRHFKGIEALAESIKDIGLQQPITVRPYEGRYIIIAGERRWRAANLAGLEEIEVIVRQCDEAEAFRLAIVENVQRADFTPIEEAEAFQRLQDQGMTQAEIGRLVGKGQSHVAQKLRLLKAPEPITYFLRHGLVTENHVRQVLRLRDIYGEHLESPMLRKRCDQLAQMVQPIDAGFYLYTLRPEEVPCAIFFATSPDVAQAVSSFYDYVSKHTDPLPQWVVAGFWWLSIAVRCEFSVGNLTTAINAWKERYECALLFWNVCRCEGSRTILGGLEGEELYWAVRTDLKHSASLDRDLYEVVPEFETFEEAEGWISRMILPSRYQNAVVLKKAFRPAAGSQAAAAQ